MDWVLRSSLVNEEKKIQEGEGDAKDEGVDNEIKHIGEKKREKNVKEYKNNIKHKNDDISRIRLRVRVKRERKKMCKIKNKYKISRIWSRKNNNNANNMKQMKEEKYSVKYLSKEFSNQLVYRFCHLNSFVFGIK